MEERELHYSNHAALRLKQYKITGNDVNKAVNFGNKVDFGYSKTNVFYNRHVKVVKSGNHIVTVNRNRWNDKCDLLKDSKYTIENLKYRVEIRNDDVAMCQLAEFYLNGKFGNIDAAKAFDLYLRASNLGNSHAMCILSLIYREGIIEEPNENKADEWLMKAADHGNSTAISLVGQKLLFEYAQNKIKEDNPDELKKKIMYYLEMGAGKCNTRAMVTLGFIHEFGLLGSKDIKKAIQLYCDAGRTGSPTSLRYLTNLCDSCLFSCEKLEVILNGLVQYLSKSSLTMLFELGVNQIISEVGFSPSRGVNMVEAAVLNLRSHEQAMVQLINCYKEGLGCKQDLKLCQYWCNELFSLYKSSSEQGNLDSLWELGKFYLKGKAGDIDLEKAESCFKKAAAHSGKLSFKKKLTDMYCNGLLGDRDVKLGEDLLKDVLKTQELKAMQGDSSACLFVGTVYYCSQYSFSSYCRAYYWLTKASAAGVQTADVYLANIFLNRKSGYTNIKSGLLTLEKLIITHYITPTVGMELIDSYLNSTDNEYIQWLKEKSEMKTSNIHNTFETIEQLQTTETEEFVLKRECVYKLAHIYYNEETKDIELASKYWYQLVDTFNLESYMSKLIKHYEQLPSSMQTIIKAWAEKLPNLILDSTEFKKFFSRCLCLANILLKGKLLMKDELRSATYWCIHYFHKDQNVKESLPTDYISIYENLKESGCVVEELLKLVERFKISCLLLYRILSRILGDVFFKGVIIKQDIEKAIHWYCEASKLNNARASLALAKIHRTSKRNLYRSLKFYKLAVNQGSQKAKDELMEFIQENDMFRTHLQFLKNYTHKSSVPQHLLHGIRSFKNLPQYPSNSDEMFEIAMNCLKEKDSNKQNLYNAVYWLRKCTKRGMLNSYVELCKIYESGLLGESVKPVANTIKINIIICITRKLKEFLKHPYSNDFVKKQLQNMILCLSSLNELSDGDLFQEIISNLEQCSLSPTINFSDIKNVYIDCLKVINDSKKHMSIEKEYCPEVNDDVKCSK